MRDIRVAFECLDVGVHHHPHQPAKVTVGSQPSFSPALRRIAYQQINLGRPHKALVLHDVLAPVKIDEAERLFTELLHRVGLARRDDVVVRPSPQRISHT